MTKAYEDPTDPLFYAPPWLNEKHGERHPFAAANGNRRDDPAPSAQRRPARHGFDRRFEDPRYQDQLYPEPLSEQQHSNPYGSDQPTGDAHSGPPPQPAISQARTSPQRPSQPAPRKPSSSKANASQRRHQIPRDIFAEAVARAMELELEPEYVEYPAALRRSPSLGFGIKAVMATGTAALIAFACVFFFANSGDTAPPLLPALQSTLQSSWQSLTASMFPAPEPRAAPTLVAQDSSGAVDEPLRLGITVDAAGAGASVTIDKVPAGARLTAGKRMSASEWRIPADQIAETSIIPPADFAGEVNLTATLRSSDGVALVSSFVRLSWGDAAPPDPPVASSNDGLIEPSFVLPAKPHRQLDALAGTR